MCLSQTGTAIVEGPQGSAAQKHISRALLMVSVEISKSGSIAAMAPRLHRTDALIIRASYKPKLRLTPTKSVAQRHRQQIHAPGHPPPPPPLCSDGSTSISLPRQAVIQQGCGAFACCVPSSLQIIITHTLTRTHTHFLSPTLTHAPRLPKTSYSPLTNIFLFPV
jgi:hypothetical protein